MTTLPTNAELAEMLKRIAGPYMTIDADTIRLAAFRLRSDPPVDEQGVGGEVPNTGNPTDAHRQIGVAAIKLMDETPTPLKVTLAAELVRDWQNNITAALGEGR